MQYTELLFGLRAENLNPELWSTVFFTICERFPNIMVHDVQNSFKYAVIEKKPYQTLTRDEIIQPVFDYWMKRSVLKAEIERMEKMEAHQRIEIDKGIEFKQAAKLKYIQHLNDGTPWDGTEFEADAIARNFASMLTQETKNEIMIRAKKEKDERVQASKDEFFVLIPSWEKIFSRLVVEECIKRNIKYVTD